MKYKIGDVVWYAKVQCYEASEPCPDCFGQRALTVIKGDGSQVSIECAGCATGYEPAKGYIKYSAWRPDVAQTSITRIEMKADGSCEYGHGYSYSSQEDELCENEADAIRKAEERMAEHNAQEIARIHQKEKHNRTWSWNAHYHRSCIKRAEKDLAYHTAKLSVAKVKAKE